MTEEKLSPTEWDFEKVPDGELVACCYWEYARESVFIRQVRQHCLQNRRAGGYREQKLCDDLETIQSLGYPCEVFLRGFFLEPSVQYQCHDNKTPNYRHPRAPQITGSFSAPWQSLSRAERKDRAAIGSDIKRLMIVPIRLAHWSLAKDIARKCQRMADEQHLQRTNWEKEYLSRDGKGNLCALLNAPKPPRGKPIRPRMRWGIAETVMVDIAWECFTNDAIANYFRKWVKVARPKETPNPDGKGHNKARDWRVALERLAMMRILHRFRLSEVPTGCANAWRLYSRREWYKERKRAGEMFHRLFPFVARTEGPLSWPTKGGHSD